MLNNIAIGLSVTLDMQTRTLTRTRDGENVTLPASACLCLQALVEAKGEVLSQEQLMDIGWRSAGVEVTENSVRVMINKLRRALNNLDLQDTVTLLAVTRSGYRLIVRDDTFSEPPPHPLPEVPAVFPQPQPIPAVIPAAVKAPWKKSRKCLVAAVCGIIAGVIVSTVLHSVYIVTPVNIEFTRWNGPGIPPDTVVLIPEGKSNQQATIEATLQTYTSHVLNRRPKEKPARVLYVTLADDKTKKHLGLIACQQPFQDKHNDCESFYFRFY